MPNKPTICVVTTTRADYGLLFWLIKGIKKSNLLNLELVVTGSHLSSRFGSTYKFIEAEGFKINKKIKTLNDAGIKGIGNSAGLTISKFTQYFLELRPSAVVVLGDRYEVLAVAQAAAISTIPLIHLHGGEITEGANDDLFRHAITKLSSFHFTSNIQHRNRVIQMGEKPSSVKVVGALGIENIKRLKLLSRSELEKEYSIKFNKRVFLITFHPATLEKEPPENQFYNLLKAISRFKDSTYIISRPNADAGSEKISRLIDLFSKQHKDALVRHSFGQLNYLSFMKIADVVIGNSSSGIIEAPSLRTLTVNIGTRQKGRMCSESVIHCSTNEKDIIKAIESALTLKKRKSFKNPYDHGFSSSKIIKVLEKVDYQKLLPKKFYDIKKWNSI